MDKTDSTIELIQSAMSDASLLCHQFCLYEDYCYTFSDIVAVTKLILEEEQREWERSRS